MKKFFVLCSLFLVVIFCNAFSINAWKDSIYHQIKTETKKALEQSLNKKVKIGSVSGRIVGQVIFHDVSIPGIAEVPKIYINFNLLKLAYKRDIVPAISKITFEEGRFFVVRQKTKTSISKTWWLPQIPKLPLPRLLPLSLFLRIAK